jgi:hypothetical protein
MLTFFQTVLSAFLPPLQQRQRHSLIALSLYVVLGTVLTRISHRPTPKTTQLVPDGVVPSHTFIDSDSFPANPSIVSFAVNADHPAGLAPHTHPSTYTPLPTIRNTYLPQVSHLQLPPSRDAPNLNTTPAHLLRPVQTRPGNRICTNQKMIPYRPGAGEFNGWARNA